MKHKVIVLTNSGAGQPSGVDAEQRDAVTAHLQSKNWEVWHWFEDVWLVAFESEESLPMTELREELRELIGLKHVMVMEVQGPINYSAFGPKSAWPWLAANWGSAN